MPQSLSKIYVHLIFSTKNRVHLITENTLERLHAYMAGIFEGLGCHSIIVGGTTNHVHALFCLGRTKDISEVVREVKSESSRWYSEHQKRVFQWQKGYGAFSVGHSDVPKVTSYISNQKEHHRYHTFKEEYLEFLETHDAKYDPKYVWD